MAVKIFCNACQKYIRDAKPNEMSELKGTEICEPCKDLLGSVRAELDKAKNRSLHRIEQAYGKGVAEIDDAMRRVIKGEAE
jgi:hypothetical protein